MKIKLLSWIPAVIMMIIIFVFSSKPAEVSDESSMTIAGYIYSVFEKIYGNEKTDEERMAKLETLDHIVRKGAHVTEFALLAASFAWPLSLDKMEGLRLAVTSVGLAATYAAADEFHQTFVPGRSGNVKDICIDTAGAALGYGVFIFLMHFCRKKQKTNTH